MPVEVAVGELRLMMEILAAFGTFLILMLLAIAYGIVAHYTRIGGTRWVWLGLLAVVVLWFIWGIAGWYAMTETFRYRLTVAIEADGQVHSASSVIEVRYLVNYDPLTGRKWHANFWGVSPLVDLGQYGTIAAVLGAHFGDYDHQRKINPARPRGRPILLPDEIPLVAYQMDPRQIRSASGSVVLEMGLPNFVWIPRSGWEAARQVLPEEFPEVIGSSVQLKEVTVEPAPWAPLVQRIDPMPLWLTELVRWQRAAYRLREPDKYVPRLLHFQTDNSPVSRTRWKPGGIPDNGP